jgi:hypothetical protein
MVPDRIKRVVGAGLDFVLKHISRTELTLIKWNRRLAVSRQITSTDRGLHDQLSRLTVDVQKFSATAKDRASHLDLGVVDLSTALEIYFLTKSTIAVCESKGLFLPLQVFNEFRAALDHFMRAVVVPKSGIINHKGQLVLQSKLAQDNIKAMEGHIQRAFLDMVKIGCSDIRKNVDDLHKDYRKDALGIAGPNHEYLDKIHALQINAEELLSDAKIAEADLGTGQEHIVREKFLYAFRAHCLTQDFQRQKIPDLAKAQAAATRSWRLGYLGSLSTKILAGVIAGLIVFTLGGVFGKDLIRYAESALSWIKQYIQ